MKKFMIGFIAMSLLINTMASAAMSPKQLFLCGLPGNKCTDIQKKESLKWWVGIPVAIIVAVAAAAGIVATAAEVKSIQAQKKREAAAHGIVQAEKDTIKQKYHELGLQIKKLEDDIAMNEEQKNSVPAIGRPNLQRKINGLKHQINELRQSQKELAEQIQ